MAVERGEVKIGGPVYDTDDRTELTLIQAIYLIEHEIVLSRLGIDTVIALNDLLSPVELKQYSLI